MLPRCILSVFAGLALFVATGCADPEPEKAIFVVREATTTIDNQPEGQTSAISRATSTTADVPIQQKDEVNPATTEQAPPTVTTVAPQRRWTLLAGGDVLLDRTEPEGIDPFAKVQPNLTSANVAIVNLEMAITERGEPYDKELSLIHV